MKRLLVVTSSFPPCNSVGSLRIAKICKYLDESRWRIYVLTVKEKYLLAPGEKGCFEFDNMNRAVKVYRTVKPDPFFYLGRLRKRHRLEGGERSKSSGIDKKKENRGKIKLSRVTKGIGRNVRSIFTIIHDLFRFPDENITWLPSALSSGLKIIFSYKIDVIYSSSPKHSNHLIALILKKATGKRLIVEFRDPWARSPWRETQRSSSWYERQKHKIIKLLERLVVENADKIVCVTSEMRDDFTRNYAYLPASKFHVFYSGYDPDCRQRSNTTALDKTEVSNGKVQFIHTGSLYKMRNPKPVLLAIRNLKSKKLISADKVQFVFLGKVSKSLSEVTSLPTVFGIEDIVSFYPKVNYEKSFEFMKRSDVFLLLQPHTKLQLPAKVYDYLCHNKPIFAIGEKHSAVKNMIDQRFGIFAHVNDIEDIECSILKLVQNHRVDQTTFEKYRQKYNIAKNIVLFEKILAS